LIQQEHYPQHKEEDGERESASMACR
jgi:hypothetical protein